MKKNFKWLLVSALGLAFCALTFGACNAGKKIDSDGILEYDYTSTPAFGAQPDENVLIDGKLDEELWENLDYMDYSDPRYDATVHVTTHFSEKGLYIGAYSDDSKVFWNGRNYFNYNTYFGFRIAPEGETAYTKAVKTFSIDAKNVGPCTLRVNAKSAVLGEPLNTGASDGLSVEAFILWEDLGITLETETDSTGKTVKVLPEKIQLCPIYRHVLSESGLSSRGFNVIQSFNGDLQQLANYAEFGENGYLAVDLVDATVGDSVAGMAKSAAWDISKESEGIVRSTKGYYQGIFFKNEAASSFVMSTKMRFKNVLSTISAPRAGLFTYKDEINYRAAMIDFSDANLSEGMPVNNALFAGTHYPNNSYAVTNLNKEPSLIEYSGNKEVELTVIKDGSMYYYIINDNFVCTERQDYMLGSVYAGLYSCHAEVEFYDYEFKSFDGNAAGIAAEIKKYCYTVSVPGIYDYAGGTVSTDVTAVPSNDSTAKANITVVANSGYKLTNVYSNGVSILDSVNADAYGFTLDNFSENVNITADFAMITGREGCTLSGVLRSSDGSKTVGYADMEFVALDENDDEVPLSCIKLMASAYGQYNVILQKGYQYKVTVVGDGYRKTTFVTDVLETNVSDYEIKLSSNIVGGAVDKVFGLDSKYIPNSIAVSVKSNTTLWDLSKEAEGEAYFHTTNWTTGNAYFSDQAGYNFVAETTITNVTNPNIGSYEKYPNAGFTVTNGITSLSFRLYDKGIVIYPVGTTNWQDRINVYGLTEAPTVGTIGLETKFKLMRVNSTYYIFINDQLVYTYTGEDITVNTKYKDGSGNIAYENLVSPVAVGFCTGSTYALDLKFSDYRIAFDDEAMEEIYETAFSKVSVATPNAPIELVGGVDANGYVELGESFTLKGKNLDGNSVYVVKVYGNNIDDYKSYLISAASPTVKVTATMDSITNVSVEKETQIATVMGTVATVDGASVVGATASILWDDDKGSHELKLNSGAFSVKLPYGSYILKAWLDGYYSKEYDFTVSSASVSLPTLKLSTAIFGGSVTVDGKKYDTHSLWLRDNDTFQVPGHPYNTYQMNAFFSGVTASEYVVTATTRSSTVKTSPYYNNDNAQGLIILGNGGKSLVIGMWGGGFRLVTSGVAVRTDGLGKGFLNDMKGNSHVDIVQTVVRRGNALYVFVGEKDSAMELYLIISPEDGLVLVGDKHVIHSGSTGSVSAFNNALGSVLGEGVLNGFGYCVVMNMSVETNFNNSMIYDLGYDLTASGIDAMLTNAITENCDTTKGTVAYSGEGYVASGKKYVAGKPITITVAPKDGYSMASLTVNGKAITDYTVGANGTVSYTGTFDGAITVEVLFKEAVFTATANLTRVQYLSSVSIVATSSDGAKTIEAVFEKSTSGNSIVIELPVGTWTLTFKNSSGNAVATGTVTITGVGNESPTVTMQ